MACQLPFDKTCWPNLTSDIDLAKMQICADAAVAFIWAKTGQRFGYCPVIARPCPQPCNQTMWYPLWDGTAWRNTTCGCLGSCKRIGPSVIHLNGPVFSITQIIVEGVVLAPSMYTLEGDYLYMDSCASWPTQNLQCGLGEPDTWSVEYLRGFAPPAGTGLAVGLLAKEFFTACGNGKCRLPARVQSIIRAGVQQQIISPEDLFEMGITGIPEVDLFIRTWNPKGVTSGPIVL